MSHFSTLVVIGPHATTPAEALAEAERMLAPFDENTEVEPYKSYEDGEPADFWAVTDLTEEGLLVGEPTWVKVAAATNAKYREDGEEYAVDDQGMYSMSTYNPRSQWDYHRLGGRCGGFFTVKSGSDTERGPIAYEFTLSGQTPPEGVDLARKGDIDFEYMTREAEIKAEANFTRWEQIVASLPEAQRGFDSRETIANKHGGFDGRRLDAARAEYRAQPIVAALSQSREFDIFDSPDDFYFGEPDARARYVTAAKNRALTTFAVLDSEGWHEKGRMGWFGLAFDEKDQEVWNEQFNEMLRNLPEDAWLAVFDLHI